MASVSIFLYKAKILKNGDSPIFVRVSKDRKSKYLSVGHSCPSDLWDHVKQRPKKKYPNYKELTILIEKKESEAKKLVLALETEKGDFSLEEFVQRFHNFTNKVSVFSAIEEIVEELISIGNIGNSEAYRNLRRVLSRFRQTRDFYFSDIDKSFLLRFEQDLRARNLKDSTMSYYFRTFRALYHRAVERRYADEKQNPFKRFKVSKFKTKTAKRAITRQELRLIEQVDTSAEPSLDFAKDIFLFSYYTSGINMIDVARLEDRNLKDDTLTYIRTKTKQPILVRLLEPSLRIIEKYRTQQPGNYLFPILNKQVHITEAMVKNRVKKVTKQVNAGIKQLALQAGVDPTGMTTYVARHTFATVLKRSGVATEKISELMGHDSPKTTEIYLDSFEQDQLFEATQHLL